jgi:hypothetical protein
MIAAFTNRIVLIEGPRFLNGARDYPEWAVERIKLSVEFASNPTSEGKRGLINSGVTWFYLVKNLGGVESNTMEFSHLVKLVFENSIVAIYDLEPAGVDLK